MKKLFIFLIFLFSYQCIAQQKPIIPNLSKTKKLKRPLNTDTFETLNLDDYKDGLTITKEWSLGDKTYYDNYYYEKNTDNEIITINGAKEFTITYNKTFTYTPYMIYKEYYGKSGNIYRKRIFTKDTDIVLGKEYQFDESGKLSQVIDHDLDWDFNYEKLLAYLEKNYQETPIYSLRVKKRNPMIIVIIGT